MKEVKQIDSPLPAPAMPPADSLDTVGPGHSSLDYCRVPVVLLLVLNLM